MRRIQLTLTDKEFDEILEMRQMLQLNLDWIKNWEDFLVRWPLMRFNEEMMLKGHEFMKESFKELKGGDENGRNNS